MGSRLEKVTQNVEQAESIEQQGLEQAEQDASEVSEVKSILEGINTDVDDDILSAIEATREAVNGEGADHMGSEVHGTLEQGYEVAEQAMDEGTEQAQNSRDAAVEFSAAAGASEFGSSTAESSSSQAEGLAGEFESRVETARQGMEESEDRYGDLLSEILA